MNTWNTACPKGRCVRGGQKQVFILENGLWVIHIRKSEFPVSLYLQDHLGNPVTIPAPRPIPETVCSRSEMRLCICIFSEHLRSFHRSH